MSARSTLSARSDSWQDDTSLFSSARDPSSRENVAQLLAKMNSKNDTDEEDDKPPIPKKQLTDLHAAEENVIKSEQKVTKADNMNNVMSTASTQPKQLGSAIIDNLHGSPMNQTEAQKSSSPLQSSNDQPVIQTKAAAEDSSDDSEWDDVSDQFINKL